MEKVRWRRPDTPPTRLVSMNRFHAGRPQAPLGRPAPEHYSLTRDLPRLCDALLPARALPRRRDVVSYIKCGRVQGRHPGTLLISEVLGRRISGCRRALPRAQFGAPRPQARESDVGRVGPRVGNFRAVRTAPRHAHRDRRRGHVKLIDFGTSKDLEDSTLNGPARCGNQPVFRPKLGHDRREIHATVSRE